MTHERGNDQKPAEENPGDVAPAGASAEGLGENLCPTCSGSGKVDGGACETCGGSGLVTEAIGGA